MPVPKSVLLRRGRETEGPKTGAGTEQRAAQTYPPAGYPSRSQQLMMQQQQQQAYAAHQQQQRNARFADTNRGGTVRDRYANMLTKKEIEEQVEREEKSGTFFRYLFAGVIFLGLLMLAFGKASIESMEAPDIGNKAMLGEAGAAGTGSASTAAATGNTIEIDEAAQKEIDSYYELLNVKDRIKPVVDPAVKAAAAAPEEKTTNEADGEEDKKPAGDDGAQASVDAETRKRHEAEMMDQLRTNWKVKQELKKAYDDHEQEYGQLVSCGRQCESNHKQMEVAYQTIAGQVDRELFGVLGHNGRKTLSREEAKAALEKKKKEIEEIKEEQEGDKEMLLAEVKDAYDIVSSPKALEYYKMYGRKPPEFMKHVSSTSGGWGQDMLLRTHKNKLVLAWLDYFADAAVDLGVLGVILAIGFILPACMQFGKIWDLANQITDNYEEMARMEKEERDAGRA